MAASRTYGILWRWHFLAGVIACPIVFVIALTGALYTFQPELDPMVDAQLVVGPSAQHASVDAMVRAATSRGCTVSGLVLPSARDRAASLYCLEGERRRVLVDPYRGDVVGERAAGDTVFEVIFGLHWDLMLGAPGRVLVEWATSCAMLLLLSGAALWWPRGKRTRGGVWWPRRELRGRQWMRDLHAVAGAYMLPVLFAVTASGLMWTLLAGERRWHPLTEDAVHEAWDHPPASTPIAGASPIGYDAALAAARIDRATEPLAVYAQPPLGPTGSYVFLRYDDSSEEAWHAESIWVDAYRGVELKRLGWDDRDAFGQLDSVLYSVHVGSLLGLPGRIAVCLAALVLAALCVTGPWMWWKRRPRGKVAAPPRAERRSWPLGVAIAVLGWLLPTLGVTLVAIVVVEGAMWLWRSRSAAVSP